MGACTYKFLRILLLIVSVTAICVGLKPSFQKVTFRRSSWTRTALKGDLLDSAGEIGDVAAKVGSVAADSTTAAISNFAVNLPEASEILSTTVRSVNEATAGVGGVSTKLPLDLGLSPVLVKSNLPPLFMNFISEPKYWGSIIVFVLIFDIMQNSAAVQKRNRELVAGNAPLQEELAKTEANLKTALALQVDAKQLSKDLDDARAEITAYKMRDDFNGPSAKNLGDKEAESAPAAEVASVTAETVEDNTGGVARNMEIARLRAELEEQKRKTAAAVEQASNAAAAVPSAASPSASVPKGTVSADQVGRERALVDALKTFLVEEGYMAQGMANMLMAASAPAELKKLAKGKGATMVNEEVVSDLKEKEAALVAEKAVLASKISTLEADNANLKKSSSKAGETDAYVKTLTAEVEGLKKQLLSSDERLMDLQQDMQSKVDSAKLMTKELNARLQKSTEVITALEAAAAAKSKSSAPAPAPPADTLKAPEAGGRKAELQGMTKAAVKKLTKAQLEKDALEMGASADSLKGLTKPKLLDIIFDLLG